MSIPSEHRLRKHAEFEVVYRCGQRHFSQALTAFYLLRTEPETVQPKTSGEAERNPRSSRVGITVGRVMEKPSSVIVLSVECERQSRRILHDSRVLWTS